jgi:hypothetical protein
MGSTIVFETSEKAPVSDAFPRDAAAVQCIHDSGMG